MKRLIKVLSILLVVIVAVSALALSSQAELFLFTKDLRGTTIHQSSEGLAQVNWGANITDGNIVVGTVYFRVEYDYFNISQHNVRLDIGHKVNTEMDKIVLTFISNDVTGIYMEGHPSVTYSYARHFNTHTVTIDMNHALGILQGSSVFKLILHTANKIDRSLFFSTDLYMHYMTPMQLTGLHGHAEVNTYIPEANN